MYTWFNGANMVCTLNPRPFLMPLSLLSLISQGDEQRGNGLGHLKPLRFVLFALTLSRSWHTLNY